MNEQYCEQLTLFPGDSHASHSPWLESKKVKGMTATCGLKCSELSEILRRIGLWVRMYLESCELPPGAWSRIWSARVITSRCLILRLRLSERRTDGQGSRLWQTPNVPNGGRVNPPDMTETEKMPDGRKRQVGLYHQVKMVEAGLWPTPRAKEDCDYQYSAGRKGHKVLTLSGKAKLMPTPRASDCKGSGPMGSKSAEHMRRKGQLAGIVLYMTPNAREYKNATAKEWDNPKNTKNLNRQIAKLYEGEQSTEARNGQLNPTWVEWLMGFPIGWTELDA